MGGKERTIASSALAFIILALTAFYPVISSVQTSSMISGSELMVAPTTFIKRAILLKEGAPYINQPIQPHDWGAIADLYRRYGINIAIVEVANLDNFFGEGQLPNIIAAFHARNIEVHVLMKAPSTSSNTSLWQRNSAGNPVYAPGDTTKAWPCPTNPASLSQALGIVDQILAYDIDGYQFDYARYTDTTRDACFCSHCRSAFETYLGHPISDAEWTYGGPYETQRLEWRQTTINDWVQAISSHIKAAKQISVSAAVFQGTPAWDPKVEIGQDGYYWVTNGYLDWIAPMVYIEYEPPYDIATFRTYAQWARNRYAPNHEIPMAPYIEDWAGTSQFPNGIPVDLFAQTYHVIQEPGIDAEGFAIFTFGGPLFTSVPVDIEPYLASVIAPAPDIYQGDLILTGNNVTTIEGMFEINGSIIIEENATLTLDNAMINFTRGASTGIYLQNPANGNPRLSANNTTITRNPYCRFYENSSVEFSNCSISGAVYFDGESTGTVSGSTVASMQARSSSTVSVSNSVIEHLDLVTTSANSSISHLAPGLCDFWDFWLNCSVVVAPAGKAPYVTLTQTTVDHWSFSFQDASNARIQGSQILSLHANGLSHALAYNCTIYSVDLYHSVLVELTNSTLSLHNLHNQATVCVRWYLNVHVVDSTGQDVPSANVTAFHPNATVAESELTGAHGWSRLTLTEKMMNLTDEYPVGNYTIEATYDLHSDDSTVNMTESQQITLTLEAFVIPEFASFLTLPLFMIATLLAAIIYRRKQLPKRS